MTPRAGAGRGARSVAGHERPLGDRFVVVMRLVRVASSRPEIAGLSNARYEFLHALVHGGPTRMSALARHLRISPRTVKPMVDALEADGVLGRSPDPTDRRAQVLSLTPAGLELMKDAHVERMAIVDPLFAHDERTQDARRAAGQDHRRRRRRPAFAPSRVELTREPRKGAHRGRRWLADMTPAAPLANSARQERCLPSRGRDITTAIRAATSDSVAPDRSAVAAGPSAGLQEPAHSRSVAGVGRSGRRSARRLEVRDRRVGRGHRSTVDIATRRRQRTRLQPLMIASGWLAVMLTSRRLVSLTRSRS